MKRRIGVLLNLVSGDKMQDFIVINSKQQSTAHDHVFAQLIFSRQVAFCSRDLCEWRCLFSRAAGAKISVFADLVVWLCGADSAVCIVDGL